MEVDLNRQRQMQMVAFTLITVIWFFMPIRTRPEWACGQPSACTALITVRRSFIWRTFIYSFNFLSFMCSAPTTRHCYTPRVYAVWNVLQIFLIGKCRPMLSLHFAFQGLNCIHRSGDFCLLDYTWFCLRCSERRSFADAFLHQLPKYLILSRSCCCYLFLSLKQVDTACKSIPFPGKQRLITQRTDACCVLGPRPQIWVGWYQTDSWHLSLSVQRSMK